jgi:hypothetical protein
MLPQIGIVDSVEMIRDGGSLAAVFHGTDSCEYWLFLEILTQTLGPNEIEKLGYAKPQIVDRLTGTVRQISWQHAAALLGEIGGMIHRERDVKWHGVMKRVIACEGNLPHEIERVSRVFRL